MAETLKSFAELRCARYNFGLSLVKLKMLQSLRLLVSDLELEVPGTKPSMWKTCSTTELRLLSSSQST